MYQQGWSRTRPIKLHIKLVNNCRIQGICNRIWDPNFTIRTTTVVNTDQRDEGGGVGRQHGQSLLRGRSNLLEPIMTNKSVTDFLEGDTTIKNF